MDLLEKFAPKKKKKKTLVLTNVGKRAMRGVLHTRRFCVYSESNMGMEEHTRLHSEPAGKGWQKKKKTLVLTLGRPSEKGGIFFSKKPWY